MSSTIENTVYLNIYLRELWFPNLQFFCQAQQPGSLWLLISGSSDDCWSLDVFSIASISPALPMMTWYIFMEWINYKIGTEQPLEMWRIWKKWHLKESWVLKFKILNSLHFGWSIIGEHVVLCHVGTVNVYKLHK